MSGVKYTTNPLADANNQLAVLLHKKLSEDIDNVFFSPFSISVAMAMLFKGAKEETADEMRSVLGFDHANLSNDQVHDNYGELLEDLGKVQEDYTLAVSNALVSHIDFELLSDYKSELERVYKALALEADFIEESAQALERINNWVKQSTRDMIPKVLDSLDPATVLVLLNAVYFKGTWMEQFDKRNTMPRPFYNNGKKDQVKDVPIMYMSKKFRFVEKEDYKALVLPYKGDRISMLLLLPKEIDGLSKLESSLESNFVQNLYKDLNKVKVDVSLPKLHVEYSKELRDIFRSLGLNSIFEPDANFKGLSTSNNIAVSNIVHKAVLDVNEEGSEAAAVTAVVMVMCCLEINSEFCADHPFLYVIFDETNNMILFMGRIKEL